MDVITEPALKVEARCVIINYFCVCMCVCMCVHTSACVLVE